MPHLPYNPRKIPRRSGEITDSTVVKVTFKNTKTKKSTTKKYRCVVKAANKPVEEKSAKITAIKQEKASTLTATFSADVTGVSYGAISVVRDETKAVVTVKSITVDKKDNTKATIETYEALSDGKAYTVTYKAADGTESSATFTATDGKVADIALNTYSIPANTPTQVKYQTLDANGVIIEEKGIGSSRSNAIDVAVENANGYQNDDELLLYKTGDTATVKVTYHTFKYDNTNGTETGKVEKTFTVTAVDPSSVIETYDYSVVADEDDVVDFRRDALVTQIAMGDDNVDKPNGGGKKQPAAKFSFRKADGTNITKTLDYTVSSGNENVLLASGNVADDKGAALTPVAPGATYLIIKDASGNVVTTLPITVVAKRSLSTMTLDKSSVTVSAGAGVDAVAKQKITVAVMDQYSKAYTSFIAAKPECSNKPGSGLDVDLGSTSGNKTSIIVSRISDDIAPGTYTYTMDLTDSVDTSIVKKISFNVIVSRALDDKASTYALVMVDEDDNIVSKVDTTVTAGAYNAGRLTPTIVKKNNNAIVGKAANVVSIGAVTLTKNGAKVKNESPTDKTVKIYGEDTLQDNTPSAAFVDVAKGDGTSAATAIEKCLEPGTYTVSFVATITKNDKNEKQPMSTSFVVEDTQKAFEASVKSTSIASGTDTMAGIFEDEKYVTFSYAGDTLDKATNTYSYKAADYTKVNNQKSISVNKVIMNTLLPGTGNKYVYMSAKVGRTFTFADIIKTDDVVAAENATNAAIAQRGANADAPQAIEDIKAASGGAVANGGSATKAAISTTFANVKATSGSSIVSVTACAVSTTVSDGGIAAASAGALIKVEPSVSGETLTVAITFPDGAATISANNTLVIKFSVTVRCTYAGQSATATEVQDVTYKWDDSNSKWIPN